MKNLFIYCVTFLCCTLTAQDKLSSPLDSATPSTFVSEGIESQSHTCLGSQLTPSIIAAAKEELKRMESQGKAFVPSNAKSMTGLEWPLRAAVNYDACNYYSIFQYYDHNPAIPAIEDYNCGTITYDVPGYNHDGTDIGLYPYGRTMQANNSVEVIAAAGGMILQKIDGNFDQNCDGSDPNWNFILIQHADGTRGLYGHMKDGSLTSLQVGDMISTGDYIGVVGSSGASTGPHLHFAIFDSGWTVIDPFEGTCNNVVGTSLWASQKPYFDQHVNRVMTHNAVPSNGTCPQLETINEQTLFEPGSTIFFSIHISHARPIDTYTVTVRRPNGSIYSSLPITPTQFFSGYTSFFSLDIPTSQPLGQWTFECSASFGEMCSTTFSIEDCEADLNLNNMPIPVGITLIDEEAANSIISNISIGSGVDATYDAGNFIELQEGFHAQNNSDFKAFIDGCGGL